ncbi:MAG: glycosyltransferase family 39 protein [Phycisphaeraceae bacterium]|nr:glycosyltransferase family 39 protein [Phycisphaeraceae bacterium]
MNDHPVNASHPARPDRSPWPVVLAIAAALLLVRLGYLAWLCPYTLAEDEAHYWDWSRSLDWSYYSKGPGVAWLIAAMTSIFGVSELGIRAGAALMGSIATIGVAGLAHATYADRRTTIATAALFNLIPFYQVSALLMTIDMPYVACWAVGSWAAMLALHKGGRWAWIALGASIAVGFLFKYTMAMIVPGILGAMIAGHLASKRTGRPVLRMDPRFGRWAAFCVLVALAGLAPVLIWNAERDWPTVRHLLGHLGVKGGDVPTPRDPWTPKWFFEFVAVQIGLIGPALALMYRAIARGETGREDSPAEAAIRARARTLAWMGLPLIGFYLVVSLINDAEGNWAIAGYVTLVPLAARLGTGRKRAGKRAGRRYPAWLACWVVGVVVAICFARLDILAKMPLIGRAVPLGRLMQSDLRAHDVDRYASMLAEETGLEPFVIASHYGRASQLAFYMKDRPRVYCAGPHVGGRKTQFDMWTSTDLSQRSVNLQLSGRPAVLVGSMQHQWERAFEHIEPIGAIDGETKPDRVSFLGYAYRGFTGPRQDK